MLVWITCVFNKHHVLKKKEQRKDKKKNNVATITQSCWIVNRVLRRLANNKDQKETSRSWSLINCVPSPSLCPTINICGFCRSWIPAAINDLCFFFSLSTKQQKLNRVWKITEGDKRGIKKEKENRAGVVISDSSAGSLPPVNHHRQPTQLPVQQISFAASAPSLVQP